MFNRKSLHLILLLIYCSVLFSQSGNESGLQFQSFNFNKDKRTSLHITSQGQFAFNDYFALEFDLKIQAIDDIFGYVTRIILGDELNYDLMLNNPTTDNVSLILVANNKNLFKIPTNDHRFNTVGWNHVKIVFDRIHGIVRSEINKQVYTFDKQQFPQKKEIDVCFGLNKKVPFVTVDVAPVIIKNVAVGFSKDKTTYLWKLDKHGTGEVYDDLQNKIAKVTNPRWTIDNHISWSHNKQFKNSNRIFPVFNGSDKLFVVCENKIISYNLLNSKSEEFLFAPSIPVKNIANKFTFDVSTKQIVYHDFDSGLPITSNFDFGKRKWSKIIEHLLSSSHQHNNNFYSPVDSSFYQIFGYGFHLYRADINRITKEGNFTLKSFSPKITPRYLSAVGIKDSLLYIYGGIGNPNGKQEYGSDLYNDLYVVNLKSFAVSKKWSQNTVEKSEIAARSLIIDSTGTKGLALMFNPTRFKSYLILNEIDIQRPNIQTYADTIPYIFQDTRSEANLIYSKLAQKLFAITVHMSESNEYYLNIYEISYPVLTPNEVIQKRYQKSSLVYFIILFFALVLALIYWLRIRKLKTKKTKKEQVLVSDVTISELLVAQEKERRKPGIYLLGGFQVIDKHQQDITVEFTPFMKLLLCIIIMYSIKDSRGISSGKLKELLWFDKSDESARNNRSVFISKIRILLSSVGNIEIVNENFFWSIEYRDEAGCDYDQSMTLIRSLQKNSNVNPEQLIKILGIISTGELLPNIQEDCLDNFKSEYSNLVIDVLLSLNQNENIAQNDKLKFLIADAVLIFDTLNEEAIFLKCKSLVKLGRIKIAKDFFDTFRKEYKMVMNEDIYTNFENFLKQ